MSENEQLHRENASLQNLGDMLKQRVSKLEAWPTLNPEQLFGNISKLTHFGGAGDNAVALLELAAVRRRYVDPNERVCHAQAQCWATETVHRSPPEMGDAELPGVCSSDGEYEFGHCRDVSMDTGDATPKLLLRTSSICFRTST